jgi:phosphatidylglycerophosphate synthase
MTLYEEIKKCQKGADKTGYLEQVIYRKFSIYFSVLFVELGLSANMVTFLGLLADLFVLYLMYTGNWIIAGILVNLAMTIDCCDGEVSRYYRSKEKNPKPKNFGGYLDEMLGTLGFTLIIFLAGIFMGSPIIGFIAMFGLFMNIIAASTAQIEFKDNKDKIARKFEQTFFGKLKGRVGFPCSAQRLFISITIIFASSILLLIFAILINAFWIMRFWLYRND